MSINDLMWCYYENGSVCYDCSISDSCMKGKQWNDPRLAMVLFYNTAKLIRSGQLLRCADRRIVHHSVEGCADVFVSNVGITQLCCCAMQINVSSI